MIEKLTRKERKQLRHQNKRVKKVREEVKEDTHHLIARFSNGSEHGLNKKKLNINKHRAIHGLFNTMITHEQIIEVFRLNYNTLKPSTRDLMIEEIVGIIQFYLQWGEFYNPKVFKNNNPPKEL